MRIALAGLLALALMACGHFEPPERTLPARIESIHIPMPRNESYEYGLEENLARTLHEEFLADGRLRIARASEADATLRVTITEFGTRVDSVNADDYPLFDTAEMAARIELTEPLREEPTVAAETSAAASYISDPRRSDFVPEPVWREDLFQNMALAIVYEVIDGEHEAASGEESLDDYDLDSDHRRRAPSIGGPDLTPTP